MYVLLKQLTANISFDVVLMAAISQKFFFGKSDYESGSDSNSFGDKMPKGA